MKNKIPILPLASLLLVLILSCSDQAESSVDKSLAAAKIKKEKKPVKPKKKEKKKVVPSDKKKSETPTVISGFNETEVSIPADNTAMVNILSKKINNFAAPYGYSTKYCFLVDMTLPSGRNRFFVYDLEKKSIISSALVAHGSCNKDFLSRPRFSNASKSGCSSLGKYKVGEFYRGKYGKSYRLYGLDNSNSNAFNRAVVIHGYDCIPDEEIYPRVLCNSQGCVMVSYNFFDKLSRIIERSDKPIVLWVYG